MFRFVGQFTDRQFHVCRANELELRARLAEEDLGQRGTGGDRCGASARLKRRPSNKPVFDFGREAQDVATDRVSHFDNLCRRREFADIARVLEVVD